MRHVLAGFSAFVICVMLSAPTASQVMDSREREKQAERAHKEKLTWIITIGAGATIITSAWILSHRSGTQASDSDQETGQSDQGTVRRKS